jgi:hypothetical protein
MFNFYTLGEIILTDIAVIVTYLVSNDTASREVMGMLASGSGTVAPVIDSTRYMMLSMFLALSVIFQDEVVLFALVIPMKMKWMALIDAVFMLYEFIKFPYLYTRVVIVVCVVYFGIFWLINRNRNGRSFAQIRRSRRFKKAVHQGRTEGYTETGSSGRGKVITLRPQTKGPIHQCTICGRTELDNPDLEFRYCSKCAGNHEYCSDHIFSHVHIEESGE